MVPHELFGKAPIALSGRKSLQGAVTYAGLGRYACRTVLSNIGSTACWRSPGPDTAPVDDPQDDLILAQCDGFYYKTYHSYSLAEAKGEVTTACLLSSGCVS